MKGEVTPIFQPYPLISLDRGKIEKWIKQKFEQRLKDRAMSDGFLMIDTEYYDYSSDSEAEGEDTNSN